LGIQKKKSYVKVKNEHKNNRKEKQNLTSIKPPSQILKRIRSVLFLSELNINITHLWKHIKMIPEISKQKYEIVISSSIKHTMWSARLSQTFRLSISPYFLSSSNKSS
jgi:hypothetical protein